jgi:hypothetical protein
VVLSGTLSGSAQEVTHVGAFGAACATGVATVHAIASTARPIRQRII